MLLIGLAQKAREFGIGPDIVMQLVPFLVPEALMFAIPATSLFSVCVVFGRMSSDNEVTALESLGLSKSTIILPALVMAFGLSLFAVWLNDIAYAWSHFGIDRVVIDSTDRIVYPMLQQEGSFQADNYSIEVDGIEGKTLIRPVITVSSGESFVMKASSGSLKVNREHQSLVLQMENASIEKDGQFRLIDQNSTPYEIPLRPDADLASNRTSPSNLYLSEISGALRSQKARVAELEDSLAIDVAAKWLTGDFVGLSHDGMAQQQKELEDARYRYNRLQVVPHRRWANGFSCLAFAIIGVPVALRLRTGNYATTFGACFVPILLLYYPLFMFGLSGAKMSTLPAWAVWMGNAACACVGILLLRAELRK